MKKLLFVAALMVATVGSLAQGAFTFSNRGSGVDAPVTGVDKTTKLDGAGFSAQAWVGDTAGSLAAVGAVTAFRAGAGAGYWLPIVVDAGAVRTVQAQARAWNNNGGAATSWTAATVRGESNIIPIALAAAPATPPPMTGLQGFSLSGGAPVIPEPSTIALGVLGAAALLLRRRN